MSGGGFPGPGVELTHLLVVGDLSRARQFCADVLGATIFRDPDGHLLEISSIA